MENEVLTKFKLGDFVKIKSFSADPDLWGKTGKIVCFGPSPGIDFGEQIGGLTWDLDGALGRSTGRYMDVICLELLNSEWDQ